MMTARGAQYSQLIVCVVLILHPENMRLIVNLAVLSYGRVVSELQPPVQFDISPSV